MTRWQRFKRRVRLLWQGECSKEGCERGLISRPLASSNLCEQHYWERMEEISREYAEHEREREIEIHAEALRRVNAGRES